MNCLSVEDLYYKNLKEVNMEFKEGNLYFVSGANNCGKTTLSRILTGLIEVENAIFYNNKDIYDMSSLTLSRKIKLLSSEDRLVSDLDIATFLNKKQTKISDDDKYKTEMKKIINDFDIDLKKNISEIGTTEKIKVLLISKLLSKPSVLVLDDIFIYFDYKQAIEILLKLKKIKDLIVVVFSSMLQLSIVSDYLYIIDKGTVSVEGKTLEVLTKDSYLNKIGLELPFMADLSLKLKYYDLIDHIEPDMDRMIDILWK